MRMMNGTTEPPLQEPPLFCTPSHRPMPPPRLWDSRALLAPFLIKTALA